MKLTQVVGAAFSSTADSCPLVLDDFLPLARRINESHEVCHVERLLRIDGADGFPNAQAAA